MCAPAVPSTVLTCSSVNAQEDITLLQTWRIHTQIGKVVSLYTSQLQQKQLLCTPARQHQLIRYIRPGVCMTAAGLDMNLAGPSQLQTTPGLLLTDPHSSGHGHKRPRTSNDDDDPSGRHGRPHPECAEPRAPVMLLFSTPPDCKHVSECRGQSSPQW